MNGYSDEITEKMRRLCDMLDSIKKSEFLSKRLSLYGGTAMNFIYLDTPRLSDLEELQIPHLSRSKTLEKTWISTIGISRIRTGGRFIMKCPHCLETKISGVKKKEAIGGD